MFIFSVLRHHLASAHVSNVSVSELVFGGLTDVLLPVAGDLAADLVGAILAGGLSQTLSTVAIFRDALPVLSLCGGALGSRPGVIVLTTWWNRQITQPTIWVNLVFTKT